MLSIREKDLPISQMLKLPHQSRHKRKKIRDFFHSRREMNTEERQDGGSIQTAEEERVKARGIKEVETGREWQIQNRPGCLPPFQAGSQLS